MNSILVVGLATVDLIYYLEKLPNKGIKYVSKKQIMSTGGNASNASIAISRLGGSVTFISKIGKIEGRISNLKKGKNGFGYDPIFIPKGKRLTFGEMDPHKKYSIDHRFNAFKKIKKFF